MSYSSFKACERTVLVGLLEYYHENDDGEYLNLADIKDLCGLTISRIMTVKVLDSLARRELIELYSDEGETYYSLTIKGIESAERAAASLDAVSKAIATVPASDRVVSLSDNEVKPALDAIESALEAIRTSNTVPEEQKGWLRSHLSAGKILLAAKRITTTALRSLLLQPLYSAWKVVGEDTGKQILMGAIKVIKTMAGWS